MGNLRALLGQNCSIDEGVVFGPGQLGKRGAPKIGAHSTLRYGSIIYGDVTIGSHFQSGHNTLVRENCVIGDHVLIGTNSVLDNDVTIGDFVKIETNCYLPSNTKIGNRVFFGPGVIVTNDRYPLRLRDTYRPEGPIFEDNVTIGGGVVICPGVTVGSGSFVAAGAVVAKDIPKGSLVLGAAGGIQPLPDYLCEPNTALGWRKYIDNQKQ